MSASRSVSRRWLPDAKRRFPKDGTAETQGVGQHAGLSQGDWVEFDAVKNTRPRASEYKVAHIRKIPRYAELLECAGEASLRAVLTRTGWRGDRRAGLWALRVSGDRVVIVDLELREDGALRIPRRAARSVAFFDFADDAVVRLDAFSEEAFYLVPKREPDGHFDWSDEADHVARVIRSLADVDDPRISDLIAWLELHQETGTGKVSAAGVDHDAALDALRSGELAERLRADRNLMQAYLEAATRDAAVAAVVAEYAREGHTEARAKLLRELEDEIAARRAQLVAAQEDGLVQARKAAEADLDDEIRHLRDERLTEIEGAVQKAYRDHRENISRLDLEYQEHRDGLKRQSEAASSTLIQLEVSISAAKSELDAELQMVEAERARAQEATAEVDRLLSVSERLAMSSSATITTNGAAVPFAFTERELASPKAVVESIDRLPILTPKGRNLLRQLVVLMRAGEVPILYGAGSTDFVRVAGQVVVPGRLGFMRADPTLVSIEDVWARPGSGTPTVLAAASVAASKGGSVLVAVTDIESSGARFWIPALSEFLRSSNVLRGLLVLRYRTHDLRIDEMVGVPGGPLSALPHDTQVAFAELALSGLFDGDDADGEVRRVGRYAPYKHQIEMLKRGIQPGQPGIVTSGTGSGKTESFMLPILAAMSDEAIRWEKPANGYLKNPWWAADRGKWSPQRAGEKRPAALRALVLYPMNALVEDQMVRLRRTLDSDEARKVMDSRFGGNRLFFGQYTSSTPVTGYEDHPRLAGNEIEQKRRTRRQRELRTAMKKAQADQIAARKHDDEERVKAAQLGIQPPDQTRFIFPSLDGGEMLSRWDMQHTPPDLLVTNASMLGAMLSREVEESIFETTRQWLEANDDAYFYLVFDELHLIRGSAGTEVSFLVKSLIQRLGLDKQGQRHKLRILASSASLPMDGEPGVQSRRYLRDLFAPFGTSSGIKDQGSIEESFWAGGVVKGEAEIPSWSGRDVAPQPFIDLLAIAGSPRARLHSVFTPSFATSKVCSVRPSSQMATWTTSILAWSEALHTGSPKRARFEVGVYSRCFIARRAVTFS